MVGPRIKILSWFQFWFFDPGSNFDLEIYEILNFDPKIHEAVEHAGEGDTQKVQAVLRKGYLFQGNLIRPAMVKVISE